MTKEEIIGGNKIIAEFMTGKPYISNSGIYVNREVFNISPREYLTDTLAYHASWDWLMPVIEKIEKGNYGVKMCRKVVEIYFDDSKEVILKTKESCRLDSLHKAVVEFIKGHNQK